MAAGEWEVVPEQGWGEYLGEAAQDFARAGVNAATFGMSDRAIAAAAAGASGRDYDEELAKTVAQTEAQRERSPVASVAGDVGGSVVLPGFGAAGLTARTAARLAPYVGRAARPLGAAYGYGLTGAGVGAAQGAGNTYTGNPMDYIENATLGGAFGGVLGSAGGAAFGRPRAAVSRAEAPTLPQQRAETDLAYDALRAHPVRYTPASFAERADDIGRALRREHQFDAPTDLGGKPYTHRVVEQMRDPPTAIDPVTGARRHISPADVDVIRKGFTGERVPLGETFATGIARRGIDDFMVNPPPGAVTPATQHLAADAARTAQRARALHASGERLEGIEDLIHNARLQAGSADSGLNVQNILRQNVKAGLKQKKGESKFADAGYNPAELRALEDFTTGTWTNNRLRQLDRFLGGGGGLGAYATAIGAPTAGGSIGYFKDSPAAGFAAGAGLAGAGLGLRLLGNRRATADIKRIRDMIAMRDNPLYQERVATAGVTRPGRAGPAATKAVRDAAALALLNQAVEPRRLYMDMEKNKSRWE